MAQKPKKTVDPRDALADELLSKAEFKASSAEDLQEQIRYFASRLFNKTLEAELDQHLGYAKREAKPTGQENERNGHSSRSVRSDVRDIELNVPRDRDGSFEPIIVKKYQRRLPGIDERILGLYARGMSTREIRDFFKEQYGAEVSADLVSQVTQDVLLDIEAWQKEPLEGMYPIVYFDAIRIKIRDEDRVVRPKAVYIALGVTTEGLKRVLGLWITVNETAKMWLQIFNELKQRGLNDIFIAVTDGLTGLPEAMQAAYPQTKHQTCIVHMIRNSLKWVAWQDYKAVTKALKSIYQAATEPLAKSALMAFAESDVGKKYPEIVKQWKNNWDRVISFFEFSEPIRKSIYTTNAIEAMNRQIRKGIKTRSVFPNDQAALKLVWLLLMNCQKKWSKPPLRWRQAKQEFAILFEDRFTRYCSD